MYEPASSTAEQGSRNVNHHFVVTEDVDAGFFTPSGCTADPGDKNTPGGRMTAHCTVYRSCVNLDSWIISGLTDA